MEPLLPVSRTLIMTVFLLAMAIAIYTNGPFYLNKETRIVFCRADEGESTYLRLKNGVNILIDAGVNSTILDCLGKYMPLFDHTIDYAILSSPQKNRYNGFLNVMERYKVRHFIMSPVYNPSQSFSLLLNKIHKENIPIVTVNERSSIHSGEDTLQFLWPTNDFINNNVTFNNKNLEKSLGNTKRSLDNFSIVIQLKENGFTALFTSIIPLDILYGLPHQSISKLSLLKIPQHGSSSALSSGFLSLADPRVSVIIANMSNPHSSISQNTLDLYRAFNKTYYRTDLSGSIIFKVKHDGTFKMDTEK